MSKPYLVTDDGVRMAPLSKLDDFHVAEGYVDVRGWEVSSMDGRDVGKVQDLLIELDGMRTRYLQVRLHPSVAATSDDRDVLVPIASASISDANKRVVVPLDADRISLLPAFDGRHLLRTQEAEIRRHFSLGEQAAAASGSADASRHSPYDHEAFDDRRFFTRSQPLGDQAPGDSEEVARIPVRPDETVVLKKGDDGSDEIIVRRPRA